MDLAQAKAFFDQFDADTQAMLVEAAQSDLTEWTERLIEAWRSADAEGQRRARHSLKGLCENFGAYALMERCEGDLSGAAEAAVLRECRAMTIQVLREAAQP